MAAEKRVRLATAKILVLLQSLELLRLWSHRGLNFEKLHGMIEPVTGEQLYSLRVTRSVRAIGGEDGRWKQKTEGEGKRGEGSV